MRYYSTSQKAPMASLEEAVTNGLAQDRGLYMPERIQILEAEFFKQIDRMGLAEMASQVAMAFFGEDVARNDLERIVRETLSFEIPVRKVTSRAYALELFHGPTLAFKDVGARFMARLLSYFIHRSRCGGLVNVLVATSGDTGSAVANGFLGVEGIHVYVLYPKGKVSRIQESQFTTLGQNITALEIDGCFDDCQALVKSAFMDQQIREHMILTSANSINVARFLPQSFYYFWAYSQMKTLGMADNLVISVPSGNFGNLTAGLIAARMGLPVRRFIAANNLNDVFYQYLQSGIYQPRPSLQTLANAMDVGDPSNFARILDLYGNDWNRIREDIQGATYTDQQIRQEILRTFKETGYILDPHGACGMRSLRDLLREGETGVFLETAHPAKFKERMDEILPEPVRIPEKLQAFMKGQKQSVGLGKDFKGFKEYLMSRDS